MKTLNFEEARDEFEAVFELAAGGETVIIQRQQQRVALQPLQTDVAPPGYFARDYSADEIAELNALAGQTPPGVLP